jgi:hypothetical protein
MRMQMHAMRRRTRQIDQVEKNEWSQRLPQIRWAHQARDWPLPMTAGARGDAA